MRRERLSLIVHNGSSLTTCDKVKQTICDVAWQEDPVDRGEIRNGMLGSYGREKLIINGLK